MILRTFPEVPEDINECFGWTWLTERRYGDGEIVREELLVIMVMELSVPAEAELQTVCTLGSRSLAAFLFAIACSELLLLPIMPQDADSTFHSWIPTPKSHRAQRRSSHSRNCTASQHGERELPHWTRRTGNVHLADDTAPKHPVGLADKLKNKLFKKKVAAEKEPATA